METISDLIRRRPPPAPPPCSHYGRVGGGAEAHEAGGSEEGAQPEGSRKGSLEPGLPGGPSSVHPLFPKQARRSSEEPNHHILLQQAAVPGPGATLWSRPPEPGARLRAAVQGWESMGASRLPEARLRTLQRSVCVFGFSLTLVTTSPHSSSCGQAGTWPCEERVRGFHRQ